MKRKLQSLFPLFFITCLVFIIVIYKRVSIQTNSTSQNQPLKITCNFFCNRLKECLEIEYPEMDASAYPGFNSGCLYGCNKNTGKLAKCFQDEKFSCIDIAFCFRDMMGIDIHKMKKTVPGLPENDRDLIQKKK